MSKLGDITDTLDHTSIAGDDLVWMCRGSDGAPALMRADELKSRYAPTGPMARYKSAGASAATTPFSILTHQDSIGEGTNPSHDGGDPILDRWMNRFVAYARTRFGLPPGGVGYVNLINNVGATYWSFSLGGSGSTGVNLSDAHAFAHQSYGLGNNVDATLTYVGTSCWIHYKLGGSPFTVSVDGGTPVTVTPAAGSTYTGRYYTPVLSHGTHTVVCHPVSSSNHVPLLGAFLFDGDENGGIWLADNSQAGETAGFETIYSPADQLTLFPNPALIAINLVTNDLDSHTATATMVGYWQSIIAADKALCSIVPSFAVIMPHERGDYSGSPTYAQYVAAAQTLEASDPDGAVRVVDMSAVMAKPSSGNSYDSGKVNTDLVHLRTLGNQFYASTIDAALAA